MVVLSSCGQDEASQAGGAGAAGAAGGHSAGGGGTGGTGGTGGAGTTGGTGATGGDSSDLGAFPVDPTPATRGGTMTFTNVGAPGWWPRRIDREPGDPACDYKDGTDTWGGHCCMKEQATSSSTLSPFDEEMTLLLKAINVRQLTVYQPAADAGSWTRVSWWDARDSMAHNLWFTEKGDGSTSFPGDLTHDDCNWMVAQEPVFDCGDGQDYYCPDDPGVKHVGWSGSKLVAFLGSMTFDDAGVSDCDGSGSGHPGPWVAFDASELFRDGGRKWNGDCNCYSKTGTVGDGCGEINVFEVVLDDNEYSNREFISTGVRSYQAGHVGGSVCGADCDPGDFPPDAEIIDACARQAYDHGPVVEAGGGADGCPMWRRPSGDRYFMILLDETTRIIQVAIIHPDNVPTAASDLLPHFPLAVDRSAIDRLVSMRLPED